jgi:hypothetical protein
MTARPRRANRGKALRLAYWNSDGVLARKLELDQLLSKHGVDSCLLNETDLESDRVFRFSTYVCQQTDRQARCERCRHRQRPLCSASLGSAAPAYHLASRPVQVVEAYLAPALLLIKSYLFECLSGGLPVLMAGDLIAKHTEWNSRLITQTGTPA